MTLNLMIPQTMHTDFTPKITVIGVGGGGTNAVDNMIALNLQGVDFVVANTDAQQLMHSRADRRIQLGPHITQGLGAGAKPEIGRAAAEEAADELYHQLNDTHMVFITAGMGGGTGTGAAPVIARMAKERNVLTVGVVTKPFTFEGSRRARAAEAGIEELQQYVDTLIVIPNQNLFRLANERTGWKEAFKMADHVLYMGVRGVTDLMMAPGLVNLDFADIRTVMAEMGKAMMGTGEAEGENRAVRAAEAAISNPLLEDTSMAGARGLLINITGGEDMTLYEVDQAANRIRDEVDSEANIIFGSAIDENLAGKVRVSVVATGIESAADMEARPKLFAVGGGGGMHAAGPALVDATPEPTLSEPTALHGELRPVMPVIGQATPAPTPLAPRPMARAPLPPMRQPLPRGPEPLRPPAPAPGIVAVPPLAATARHQPAGETPAGTPRGGLFADAPRPVTPPRPQPMPPAAQPPAARSSLFGIVTGAMRRGRAAPVENEAPAEPAAQYDEEPASHQEAPRPTVRPAGSEESGLDIPAFLRRQTS